MQTMKRQTLWMRAAVLLLALISTTMMWADQVTAEQAREQALAFVKNRLTANGRRLAPGAMPQLKQESQINGLYVFNVADNGGFVIVSNDDATRPILGFSDNGHIDADNMPDNMRAWLQGYADEIAWLQKQPAQSRKSARSRAPQKVGSHSTNTIDPMIQTRWNQGEPYNCHCISNTKIQGCVTGCVATAMAQVMKYHQWPTAKTPNVQTHSLGGYVSMEGTTFEWENMLNVYTSGYTSAQASAVSKLMFYCGISVDMEYSAGGSSASSSEIANALKTYFSYNETTQFVQRKLYSEAKWTDLIYFELAHQRPVIYSGQSSGGGHAFVCDGYKNESGIDFFHINWGWGGLSDDYFVLSALDPDNQGIGGSTSTDGYHYDQDAIIGIQKSTVNGPMSGITPNNIDLRFNSMTLSSNNITLGSEVSITLNITNNSADDFEEAMIYVGRKAGNDYLFLTGDYFAIPSGQTKDCVIHFTPTETGTYDIFYMKPNNNGSYSYDGSIQATLTVMPQGAPSNITTDQVTSSSAVVSWTPTGNVDSYKVRYRTAATGFYDGFENGLSDWEIYTEGESPFSEGWVIPTISGHDSNRTAGAFSSNGSIDYDADNWLVSPQVTLGETLSFWEKTPDSNWADTYEVLLSTTGNAIADFTITLRPMTKANAGSWSEVSIDLSAYKGMKGYIAIHHKCKDKYYLLIDDFTVGPVSAAGDWVEKSVTTNSATITGLTKNTEYECQVIGMKGGNELINPQTISFTTDNAIELVDGSTTNSGTIDAQNGQTTSVTLTGRTLYRDGNWNTICVPFDVTLADSPLAGATAKTLTDATMTGTHVTLTFGDNVSTLLAGVPYIIKWDNGSLIENPTFSGVTINKSTARQTITQANGHVKFIGFYDAFNITSANDDIYYMTANNTLKHTGIDRTLNACRAYFQFSEAATARQIVLDFGNDNGDATRIQENGEWTKDYETGAWHTLDGRKLDKQPTRKGLYIVNGKKMVIK